MGGIEEMVFFLFALLLAVVEMAENHWGESSWKQILYF